jgi:ABC-type uncharacterized transport system fused permease/ATPase subunit
MYEVAVVVVVVVIILMVYNSSVTFKDKTIRKKLIYLNTPNDTTKSYFGASNLRMMNYIEINIYLKFKQL